MEDFETKRVSIVVLYSSIYKIVKLFFFEKQMCENKLSSSLSLSIPPFILPFTPSSILLSILFPILPSIPPSPTSKFLLWPPWGSDFLLCPTFPWDCELFPVASRGIALSAVAPLQDQTVPCVQPPPPGDQTYHYVPPFPQGSTAIPQD